MHVWENGAVEPRCLFHRKRKWLYRIKNKLPPKMIQHLSEWRNIKCHLCVSCNFMFKSSWTIPAVLMFIAWIQQLPSIIAVYNPEVFHSVLCTENHGYFLIHAITWKNTYGMYEKITFINSYTIHLEFLYNYIKRTP